jgi:hypothetical protein
VAREFRHRWPANLEVPRSQRRMAELRLPALLRPGARLRPGWPQICGPTHSKRPRVILPPPLHPDHHAGVHGGRRRRRSRGLDPRELLDRCGITDLPAPAQHCQSALQHSACPPPAGPAPGGTNPHRPHPSSTGSTSPRWKPSSTTPPNTAPPCKPRPTPTRRARRRGHPATATVEITNPTSAAEQDMRLPGRRMSGRRCACDRARSPHGRRAHRAPMLPGRIRRDPGRGDLSGTDTGRLRR